MYFIDDSDFAICLKCVPYLKYQILKEIHYIYLDWLKDFEHIIVEYLVYEDSKWLTRNHLEKITNNLIPNSPSVAEGCINEEQIADQIREIIGTQNTWSCQDFYNFHTNEYDIEFQIDWKHGIRLYMRHMGQMDEKWLEKYLIILLENNRESILRNKSQYFYFFWMEIIW